MDDIQSSNESANDALFDFETYEEFRRERVKLNHDNTLKLWYSLPENLSNIENKLFKPQTLRQQSKRSRNFKFFGMYATLLKNTCLKEKIRSKGFRLWNEAFNVPPLNDESLYGVYESLGRVTNHFFNKAREYDPEIVYEELFKAGRGVWFMIAFQMQLNLPLRLTDAIFGYNMLYPYTDDFIDSNQISKAAKEEFAKVFHERLLVGESMPDPNARFDGKQSNFSHLNLPPSLKVHANEIGKIFDMVKFIESDWERSEKHRGVYMSLATIHESQMKSTLQHAKGKDGYEPTMAFIEEISAEKGGASLIAAGFLTEGRMTRSKMAYLEYMGFALQLLDDLQDFEEDMENNHRTIFTQSFVDGKVLDEPTSRLIQYCYASPGDSTFSDDKRTVSDPQNGTTLAHYVRISMMAFSITLILEAASQLQKYYSAQYFQQLSTLSPIPFDELKTISVEQKLWAIVRKQKF